MSTESPPSSSHDGRPSRQRRGLDGRVIGARYRVVRTVAAGANTLIADAQDTELDRPVTLKLIRPELAESEEFRRRFRSLMEAIASLSHPNVAAVYDCGEERVGKRDTVYVVSEHLSGGSLRDLFDRGRTLTPSQALLVGLEACRGLDFAHRKGLVHTELTPSKLVFGDDRRLRIVDFGLARFLGEPTWSDPSQLPTHVARYASPEQANIVHGGSVDDIDGKTDVYALALILSEAVTGTVPFRGDSTVSTLANRIGKLMPVSADLGRLASVLERAGRPDAAERASASQLGRALVQAANKLPRPAPIPILTGDLFGSEGDLRRPDDPTGGVARPADEPGPVLIPPGGAGPHDTTGEIESGGAGDAAPGRRGAAEPARRGAGASRAAKVSSRAADAPSGTTTAAGTSRRGRRRRSKGRRGDTTAQPGAATTPAARVAGDPLARAGSSPAAGEVEREHAAKEGVDAAVAATSTDAERDAGQATGGATGTGLTDTAITETTAAGAAPSQARRADLADRAVAKRGGEADVGEKAGIAATSLLEARADHPAPASLDEMPARPKRQRRWLSALFGVVLVAALAVLGLVAWQLFRTPTHAVPNLAGLSEEQALAAVEDYGWDVRLDNTRDDDYDTLGEVVRSSPSAGHDLAEGSPLVIYVSSGAQLRHVPNLAGMPLAEATAELEELRLAVGSETEVYHEEVPAGAVISSSVDADLIDGGVLPDTRVDVVVSQGPRPRQVPDLIGRDPDDAALLVEPYGIEVEVADGVFDSETPAGQIAGQSPAPLDTIERGGTITVNPSMGPDLVAVPNLDGMTLAEVREALDDAGLELGAVLGSAPGVFRQASVDGDVIEPGETQVPRGSRVDIVVLP